MAEQGHTEEHNPVGKKDEAWNQEAFDRTQCVFPSRLSSLRLLLPARLRRDGGGTGPMRWFVDRHSGKSAHSAAMRAWMVVVSNSGTLESCCATRSEISVQPSTIPSAPWSTSSVMIRRYSSRDASTIRPRHSSS